MIKAIIFDIDDTLTQVVIIKWQAIKETGKRYYAFNITDAHLKKYWGLPFDEMLSGVFDNVDKISNIKKKYFKVSQEFPMKPQPDVIEILSALYKKYLLAALTSGSRRFILNDFKQSGINKKLFKILQTSEDTKFHKPNPKVFDPIIQKLSLKNITKDATIYIGDSILDFQAARDAGLQFLAVTTGIYKKDDFLAQGLEEKYINHNLASIHAYFISET